MTRGAPAGEAKIAPGIRTVTTALALVLRRRLSERARGALLELLSSSRAAPGGSRLARAWDTRA